MLQNLIRNCMARFCFADVNHSRLGELLIVVDHRPSVRRYIGYIFRFWDMNKEKEKRDRFDLCGVKIEARLTTAILHIGVWLAVVSHETFKDWAILQKPMHRLQQKSIERQVADLLRFKRLHSRLEGGSRTNQPLNLHDQTFTFTEVDSIELKEQTVNLTVRIRQANRADTEYALTWKAKHIRS